jgi:hypothetical protein
LPKKPTDVELRVIKEMFEASVDGQPYDTERWGQYFRPAGVGAPGGGTDDTAAAASAPAPVARPAAVAAPVAEAAPWEEDAAEAAAAPVAAPPKATQNAQDILAMIRSRQK